MKKVIFETTLKKIRKHQPYKNGWAKLLAYLGKTKADNEPLNILTILKSCGVQDALWALRAVDHPDRDRVSHLMACDFVESVLPIYEKEYPDDTRPRECIKIARMYARGKSGDKQMDAAREYVWPYAGAGWAVWVAAWAAEGDAARDAAWAAEEKKQAAIIKKYLAVSP